MCQFKIRTMTVSTKYSYKLFKLDCLIILRSEKLVIIKEIRVLEMVKLQIFAVSSHFPVLYSIKCYLRSLSAYLVVSLEILILQMAQFGSLQCSEFLPFGSPLLSSSGNSDARALVLSASTAALASDAPIIIA